MPTDLKVYKQVIELVQTRIKPTAYIVTGPEHFRRNLVEARYIFLLTKLLDCLLLILKSFFLSIRLFLI